MNGSAASITSVTSREMTSTPTVFGRRSVRWFTTPNTAERVSKIAKKSKGVIALNFVGKRDQATNPDTSGSSPLQSPVAADGYHAWIGLRGHSLSIGLPRAGGVRREGPAMGRTAVLRTS